MLRAPNSGQKDLKNGTYSEQTWKSIVKQILDYKSGIQGKLHL